MSTRRAQSHTDSPRAVRRIAGSSPHLPDTRRRRRMGAMGWSRLSTAVSSLTAVAALIFTSLSLRETQRQVDLAEQGQVTDRFAKAVDQTGQDTMNVRLGGVYSLAMIATDSPSHREAVSSVLAAFVRSHRPLAKSSEPVECESGFRRRELDVDAALRVVAELETGPAIDLSTSCLNGAALHEARLRCATLDGAFLQNGSDLGSADLREASLIAAHLDYAYLSGADATGVRLTFADLSHAELAGATLRDADLSSAVLVRANLAGADLRGAQLVGADLTGATLTGADLRGANVDSAVFAEATIDRAGALLAGAVEGEFVEPPERCAQWR